MTLDIKYCDLEIYNWKELSDKYGFESTSQENFLGLFLNEFGNIKIDEIKGAYAFVYFRDNKYFVFRDVVGIKPICIYFDESNKEFKFGCDLNDLPKGTYEINPRKYLIYDVKMNRLLEFDRKKYYDVSNEVGGTYIDVKKQVRELFFDSVKRRILGKNFKVGILFSGGTDSTLMALTLKELGVDFTCYTASIIGGNISEGDDVFYARKIANECGFDWKLCELDVEDVEAKTREVIDIISTRNYVKVSVALPLFVALEQAKKDGVSQVFLGIGSEEVFADYKREENVENINEICIEGLKSLWIRDFYRDYMLAKYNNIKLLHPFLDDEFVEYSIRINASFKIDKDKKINKLILRDILRDLGLSERMVLRRKKAAQYGSRSDRVFEKICRGKRMKKQEYLNEL